MSDNLLFDKIYAEDCLVTMGKMAENYIDLVITSPPYDDLRKYGGYVFKFEPIANELYRVMKQGGVIIWVVADSTRNGTESGTSFKQALYFKQIGFNLYDTMIYQKSNPVPLSHRRYEQSFEYMFVFSKGKPKTFNPIRIPCKSVGTKKNRAVSKANEETYSGRRRDEITVVNSTKIHSNIFTYGVGNNDKTKHNAPFPEQLVYDQLISWSNPCDIIYDPFMGSGTTAKVAALNQRHYIGSEVNEQYCIEAERRIESALQKQKA